MDTSTIILLYIYYYNDLLIALLHMPVDWKTDCELVVVLILYFQKFCQRHTAEGMSSVEVFIFLACICQLGTVNLLIFLFFF